MNNFWNKTVEVQVRRLSRSRHKFARFWFVFSCVTGSPDSHRLEHFVIMRKARIQNPSLLNNNTMITSIIKSESYIESLVLFILKIRSLY